MSLSFDRNTFLARKTGMDVLLAYNVSDQLEYVGMAPSGTATSARKWAVQKLAYTGTNLVSVKWADGNPKHEFVWDDRAGYSY